MAVRGGHGPAWWPLLPSGPLPCPAWPPAWCGCLGPPWPCPAALWPLPVCCCIPGRCPIWTQRPPAAGDPPAAAAQIAASCPASWSLCPLLGAGEGLACSSILTLCGTKSIMHCERRKELEKQNGPPPNDTRKKRFYASRPCR